MKFGVPLDLVEERSIVEYRLMLFTVFNAAALESGMGGFELQTDGEKISELDDQVEYFKKLGYFREKTGG